MFLGFFSRNKFCIQGREKLRFWRFIYLFSRKNKTILTPLISFGFTPTGFERFCLERLKMPTFLLSNQNKKCGQKMQCTNKINSAQVETWWQKLKSGQQRHVDASNASMCGTVRSVPNPKDNVPLVLLQRLCFGGQRALGAPSWREGRGGELGKDSTQNFLFLIGFFLRKKV